MDPPPPGVEIHDPERLDRELNELLQELRVLLPGTTVLFGFLLTLSFNSRFAEVSAAEEALFAVAFFATAACVVLLVGPGVRHRTRFRERDKEALLRTANRMAIAAAVSLAVAISAVTTLVTEYLYGWAAGIPLGFVTLLAAAWFWFGWSVIRRTGHSDAAGSPPAGPARADTRADGARRASAR